jgi:hypothetical protein
MTEVFGKGLLSAEWRVEPNLEKADCMFYLDPKLEW